MYNFCDAECILNHIRENSLLTLEDHLVNCWGVAAATLAGAHARSDSSRSGSAAARASSVPVPVTSAAPRPQPSSGCAPSIAPLRL